MTDRGAQSGFTLVEAMVSLFVFALLASGCVLLLRQSVTAQSKLSAAGEAMRDIQSARALLAGDLAQVAPGSVSINGDAPAAFDGVGAGAMADRHVRFMRALGDPDPAAAFATGLVSVEYLIDDQGRLVRRLRPSAGGAPTDRIVLIGATDVRFEFNDGAAWQEEWRTPNGAPPRAVAIVASVPSYGELRISGYVGL